MTGGATGNNSTKTMWNTFVAIRSLLFNESLEKNTDLFISIYLCNTCSKIQFNMISKNK